MRLIKFVVLLVCLGCASNKPADPSSWIEDSNQVAAEFTLGFSEIYPEIGSRLGYRQFDSQGVLFSDDIELRQLEFYKTWQQKLKKKLAGVNNKQLKVDFLILQDVVARRKTGIELRSSHNMVPYYEGSKGIFNNLSALINEQSPQERKQAAVERFRQYVAPSGHTPLLAAYQSFILKKIKQYEGTKHVLVYPFVGDVKKYLKESTDYQNGVKHLLEQTGRQDWKPLYEQFTQQVKTYDKFVSEKILPNAKATASLPRPVYEHRLNAYGISKNPEDLIRDGQKAFDRVYQRYASLAKKVAKKNGLKQDTPDAVLAHLKKRLVTTKEEVKALYQGADAKLDRIIREHELVSLPANPLRIRVAGEAESRAKPVPHLVAPPLIDNDGVVPEFVVPAAADGKLAFDDFSYAAAAMVLTAHEGRPGHDLQFSRMLENPTSIIRARYAMNSVNVEGWALYAEDLVYPYLDSEEQFVTLLSRLWRISRYFLDPQVQLGRITEKEVLRVLHERVGISKVLATLDYERYAFNQPGQAPSYYHGLIKIRRLKADLEKRHGPLQLKCFNDTLLSFGLMPHRYLTMFKKEFAKCAK